MSIDVASSPGCGYEVGTGADGDEAETVAAAVVSGRAGLGRLGRCLDSGGEDEDVVMGVVAEKALVVASIILDEDKGDFGEEWRRRGLESPSGVISLDSRERRDDDDGEATSRGGGVRMESPRFELFERGDNLDFLGDESTSSRKNCTWPP